MSDMLSYENFITNAGFYFLASYDKNQPRLRPLGMHFFIDGIIYFGVGTHKNVCRQLEVFPKAEIAAFYDGLWCRITGNVIFAEEGLNKALEERAIKEIPGLDGIYNPSSGKHLKFFHISGTAQLLDSIGEVMEQTEC